MESIPTESANDNQLHATVLKTVAELRQWEREVPGVLIVHEYPSFRVVYMSERGLRFLGVSLDEIRLTNAEYHTRFFNPEDVPNYLPKIMGLIERNDLNDLVSFFQQVRPSPDHEWTWHLSATRIYMRDAAGRPLLILTVAIPIDSESHITTKVERLIQENNFLRQKQHIYASLTKREKEILRLMALGKSSVEIAGELHISEATALTHRRNIKNKIEAHSNYDITRFAQAFDMI